MSFVPITEGRWEAESGVVSITPKGHHESLIVYTANAVNYSFPGQTVTQMKAEFEANARAIAAVPEMIALLEELVFASVLDVDRLSGKAEKLLKRMS